MAKKRCSIVWDGLKAGPRYKGKDKAELDKMTAEFLKKHGSMTDSEEFGQAMRDFAEDRDYEVEDNVYLDARLFESMSEAKEKEFREAMKEGPVEFEYRKVDGTVRKAKGTLNQDLMDLPPQASGKDVETVGKKKHFVPPTVFVYWDLDAGGFRSFRKDNFIKFKKVESKKDN